MDLEALANFILNNGMAVGVTIYFLIRDWKFNEALLSTMTILKDAVSTLETTVHRLHGD